MYQRIRVIVELLEDRSVPGSMLSASLADPIESNLSLLSLTPFDSLGLFQSAGAESGFENAPLAENTSLVGAIVSLAVSPDELRGVSPQSELDFPPFVANDNHERRNIP